MTDTLKDCVERAIARSKGVCPFRMSFTAGYKDWNGGVVCIKRFEGENAVYVVNGGQECKCPHKDLHLDDGWSGYMRSSRPGERGRISDDYDGDYGDDGDFENDDDDSYEPFEQWKYTSYAWPQRLNVGSKEN